MVLFLDWLGMWDSIGSAAMTDWEVMQSGYDESELYPNTWDELKFYMWLASHSIKCIQKDKKIKFEATLTGGFFYGA